MVLSSVRRTGCGYDLAPEPIWLPSQTTRQPEVRCPAQPDQTAAARLWYQPPYSPDLDPIEQTLAKIKHWMRSAQKLAIDDICRHIGGLISTIQPNECSNYFQNAGYASIKPETLSLAA